MAFDLEEEAIQAGDRVMMQSGVGVDKLAALAVCAMMAGVETPIPAFGTDAPKLIMPSLKPRNYCKPGPAFAHKAPQHGDSMLPGEGRRRNKKKQRWSGRRQ